jgi:hypothetical protein
VLLLPLLMVAVVFLLLQVLCGQAAREGGVCH